MVFTLLLLPVTIFLVGIVPVLFLIFGIYMLRKGGDFDHIETGARNYSIFCILVSLGFLIAVGYQVFEYVNATGLSKWRREYVIRDGGAALVGSAVPLMYIVAMRLLFLHPLRSHKDWVAARGPLSRIKTFSSKPGDIDIIKGERLRSFSVADELLKWAKLKDDGHITVEEFDDARRKLLERK